jgi:hypothetical protein
MSAAFPRWKRATYIILLSGPEDHASFNQGPIRRDGIGRVLELSAFHCLMAAHLSIFQGLFLEILEVVIRIKLTFRNDINIVLAYLDDNETL